MLVWLQFAAVSAVIVFAGSKLSKYGDVIAEKTGMGRTWVGVILMASVTSLPELITGASSVALFDLPNIAIGDVMGSCMFNILIIALLDVLSGPTPISAKAHQGQVLAAGFGVLLLGAAGISIAAGAKMPALGWVGAYSLFFLIVYGVAMRTVFLFEKKRIAEFVHERAEAARYDGVSLKTACAHYAGNALLVVAAAAYLPHLGDQIAEATGLGRTFVGSIFIALTTSLPELVVSIAALRLDATDMIFGNLLGSNLFNMAILALDDVLYFKGPLLTDAAPGHIVTANAAMAMTGIAIVGLTYRVSKKHFFFAWDSIAIVAVYVFAVAAVYVMR
ncbi:MAG: sodium:calcium antiporter [Deltaproteobacteria bacterium]|nr:sodium:calcium antiporter [Deltaproteobacteria bacterium]MDZ4346846.1 sodium:calcium antiporter [Candidatus Binatia bacterium]